MTGIRTVVGAFALAGIVALLGARAQEEVAKSALTPTPMPARKSGGFAIGGLIASIDPATRAISIQGRDGAIKFTDDTDIHLMRPADVTSLTTSGYALATGVVAADRQSIEARSMSVYYTKGVMADYIHANQVRGVMKREGERITLEANGQVVEVKLVKPLKMMASQPLRFEELKPGDQVSGWAIETPDGVKAQLLFVERI